MELKFNEKGIKIFKGDNEEVLKSLESESLDLIYCDILYNKGVFCDISEKACNVTIEKLKDIMR